MNRWLCLTGINKAIDSDCPLLFFVLFHFYFGLCQGQKCFMVCYKVLFLFWVATCWKLFIFSQDRGSFGILWASYLDSVRLRAKLFVTEPKIFWMKSISFGIYSAEILKCLTHLYSILVYYLCCFMCSLRYAVKYTKYIW